MPLETGTVIGQLDKTWPLGSDNILDGDDHLRLIKAVLKSQFPGAVGQGFDIPILATEKELNFLQGCKSNVQEQLDEITSNDNLLAPPGTIMLFKMKTPPVGWVREITNHGTMMRLVGEDAGGSFGGSDDPTDMSITHKHGTDDHALTIAEMPSHNHNVKEANFSSRQIINNSDSSHTLAISESTVQSSDAGDGQAHNHGSTSDVEIVWKPKYINIIAAIKS